MNSSTAKSNCQVYSCSEKNAGLYFAECSNKLKIPAEAESHIQTVSWFTLRIKSDTLNSRFRLEDPAANNHFFIIVPYF